MYSSRANPSMLQNSYIFMCSLKLGILVRLRAVLGDYNYRSANKGFSKIQCLGNKNLSCYKLMFLCICLEPMRWSRASPLLTACPPWLRAHTVP